MRVHRRTEFFAETESVLIIRHWLSVKKKISRRKILAD